MKIPIEISKIKDPDNIERLRIIIAFDDAFQRTSLNKQIISLQEKYIIMIQKCNDIINYIKKSRKTGDSILKWSLSDIIYDFLKETEKNEFIISNFSSSLSRDIGLSTRYINYLIKFRMTYPKIEMINKEINWDKYKEILDVPEPHMRKLLIEKILNAEIKTRKDIKDFKKNI